MDNHQDPVYSSFRFVQFLYGQVTHETAAQEKESVNTRKSICDSLKRVRAHKLKKFKNYLE